MTEGGGQIKMAEEGGATFYLKRSNLLSFEASTHRETLLYTQNKNGAGGGRRVGATR